MTKPAGAREGPKGPVTRVQLARIEGAEDLPLPKPATPGSAGVDLAAAVPEALTVPPGGRALVPTGLRIAVPPGYEAQVRPRSGLALRNGITLPNSPGTIDSDYRGEVSVIVLNAGHEPFTIERGDRIAQLVVAPVARVEWQEVAELDQTERGAGGFGSTGVSGVSPVDDPGVSGASPVNEDGS